jgi:hypothetical protein
MTATMQAQFVCWRSEQVGQVMDTEALHTPDHVFLATHSSILMVRKDHPGDDAGVPYPQEQFLRDFLAPRDFAFVPVLGESGTGKSHMVRWLAAQIPLVPGRRVLLIPRSRTSLRGVVRMILDGMEGARFDEYRRRLDQAADNLSDAAAGESLLDVLALAVGPHGRRDTGSLGEMQLHLVEHLPALLHDVEFRRLLLESGGIMEKLVRHIRGTGGLERAETRREFSVADLPLRVQNVARLGQSARELYNNLIGIPALAAAAVDWINRHLDGAISQVLQLGGESLQELMRDVREALAASGTELVVLIEDFAVLQGIDRQLLEALLEKPRQLDRELCVLRTALGCTTGYYRALQDTVRTRASFVVDLDRQASGSGALVSGDDLERFAARYLNAARLEEHTLVRWADASRVGERGDARPPSACESCPNQSACHEAFGSHEGMGLYPFNGTAIHRMLERTGAREFNPRVLINKVLKHTLEAYEPDFRRGAFPSPALLTHFGGSRLGALQQDRLRESDPVRHDRRRVLVELWGDPATLADLPIAVHDAFGLPPLGVVAPSSPSSPVEIARSIPVVRPGPEERSKPVSETLPQRLQQEIAWLDAWGNGADLPQKFATELRHSVHGAVESRINWDAEGLVPSLLFGSRSAAKPFRFTSVEFSAGEGGGARASVRLPLVLAGTSRNGCALALQALLLFEHHGRWDFPEGPRHFRVYARHLELWGEHVLAQLRTPVYGERSWEPLVAATEVLAVGARMMGRLPAERILPEQFLEALFRDWKQPAESRGPAWTRLATELREKQPVLREMVLGRAGATKGARSTVQVIDATRLLPILEAVRVDWRPRAFIPEDDNYTPLRRVRDRVDALLGEAVAEEQARLMDWRARLLEALGPEPSREAAAAAVIRAVEAAEAAGTNVPPGGEVVRTAADRFRKAGVEAVVERVGRLHDERDPARLLGELSQDHDRTVEVADVFLEVSGRFLEAAKRRVDADLEHWRAEGGGDVESCLDAVSAGLRELEEMLSDMAEVSR